VVLRATTFRELRFLAWLGVQCSVLKKDSANNT